MFNPKIQGAAIIDLAISRVTLFTDIFRTNTFFYINVCGLVAQLIAPSMSAILMEGSPWTPLFLGLLTLLFSMILSLCLPETLYWKARTFSTSKLHIL